MTQGRGSPRVKALEWLHETLLDGHPYAISKLEETAASSGLTREVVHQAAAALAVVQTETPAGPVWSLPTKPPSARTEHAVQWLATVLSFSRGQGVPPQLLRDRAGAAGIDARTLQDASSVFMRRALTLEPRGKSR